MSGSVTFSRECPRKLSTFKSCSIFRFYYQKDEQEICLENVSLKNKKNKKREAKIVGIHLLNQQLKKYSKEMKKANDRTTCCLPSVCMFFLYSGEMLSIQRTHVIATSVVADVYRLLKL